ncbi:hypothetical protein [Arthrobacter sp. NQ4]|uniref:hypothetical protein n=1 Tax=Arthrobacter sp. NQ4 TaxID=3027930 RepID=UPI0023AE7FCE|nr:hypothetical protein [Arthrobacter sp. NQ4]MDE8588950.1 hypothetical protein [Arthrobacter sp. NQ4]
MISEILTGLDKKFEGRINSFYTFGASALALAAFLSGGQPPLAVLSSLSSDYFGASIPWFEIGQSWVAERSWLTPGLCIILIIAAATVVVLQGRRSKSSRSSATLWFIAVLAVSRGTNILVITLAISAVLVCGGLARQRIDATRYVAAEAVILGLISAPKSLADLLCGSRVPDSEAQDLRMIEPVPDHEMPSGAHFAR